MVSSATAKETPACRKKALVFLVGVEEEHRRPLKERLLRTMIFAIFYLPVDPWIRAFLGLGTMFLTTSSFTLAKCVRDAQEDSYVVSRIDQARVDRILSEHDPFKSVS